MIDMINIMRDVIFTLALLALALNLRECTADLRVYAV